MEAGRWERENTKITNLKHEKYVVSVPLRFFQFLIEMSKKNAE